MKFKIKNYRGITTADLELKKIAAVFGPNGAGKSSIAGAAKALLAGDPMASTGINKRDALKLVNDGAREATAILEGDQGSNEIEWPTCEVATLGDPPRSSAVALGVLDVLTMERKKRDQFFGNLLGAIPSREDLGGALEHLMNPKEIASLWKDLEASGWDAMAKHYAELATQKKGAWKQITGQNWGSAKASNYVPEHWSPQLDRASLAQLQAVVVEAQDTIEGIAASNAIDDAELDGLTALARRVPELEEGEAEARSRLEAIGEELATVDGLVLTSHPGGAQELARRVESLPLLVERAKVLEGKISEGKARQATMATKLKTIATSLEAEALPCPKCGAHLAHQAGELVEAPTPPTAEELEALTLEAHQLEEGLAKAEIWITNKQGEAVELDGEIEEYTKRQGFDLALELERHEQIGSLTMERQAVNQAIGAIAQELQNARQALERVQASEGATMEVGGDINQAREALRVAQEDLEAWRTKQNADQVAKTIDHYLEASKVLGASGIRKAILAGKIQEVNQEIASWSPWPVKIKPDLSFVYDGRPVALCCESENWRASTVVQVLVALHQEDAAIVIDRADILDNRQKNRLFKMLVAMPFSSLVLIKSDNRGDVLDLSKKGIGFSYWVEGGSCSAV